MAAAELPQSWVRDLPVCLPGRACVDQSPVAAPLIQATSALTPASALIAAAFIAVTAIALSVIVVGVKAQRRERRASPWLVMLAAALLLFGACTSWVVRSRLAVVAAIYSGLDGRAPSPEPSSLVGAWPVVLASSCAMAVVAGLALIAVMGAALLLRRRGVLT